MSERIYAWLLRLYPEDFRKEFGEEARLLFRDRLQDEKGLLPRLRFWLDVFADCSSSLVHEHSLPDLPARSQRPHADGVSLLYDLNAQSPRRGPLFVGAMLTLVLLFTFPLLIESGVKAGPTIRASSTSTPGGLSGLRSLWSFWLQGLAPKSRAEFEVASIKLVPPGGGGPSIVVSPGRLSAENVTLKRLIRRAFRTEDFQINGGPDWVDSNKYQVIAKAKGEANQAQLAEMLRTLLEDRFKLKLSHQMKELSIYGLEVGKDGSKLQASAQGGDGPSRIAMKPCGPELSFPAGATLAQLANFLSGQSWMDRPVIDRTGLTKIYDLKLQWAPEGPLSLVDGGFEGEAPPPPPPPPSSDSACPSRPSLTTALQEQLGLRLVSQKGSVEVLQVVSAERPEQN